MRQTRTVVVALEREDVYAGPLVLINKASPVRRAIPARQLAPVAPGVLLERQAALLYQAAVKETGAAHKITPVSGYRDREEQACLYADTLARRGEAYTRAYVAPAGHSEHETGLAIDVGQAAAQVDLVAPSFPSVGACRSFSEAAARHGFILRYPEGKEHITGISHEPWHFRYVGIPHSQIMAALGLTLEEYTQWLKGHPWGRQPYRYTAGGHTFAVGYVPAAEDVTEIALHSEPYTISGNNVDGFAVAVWGCGE